MLLYFSPPLHITTPQNAKSTPASLNTHALSVLGLDKIRHRLGLAGKIVLTIRVRVVVVSVAVSIVLRADILKLVHRAALRAALDGSVARRGEPDDDVTVRRTAGAADVLLISKGLDDDGIVERACM